MTDLIAAHVDALDYLRRGGESAIFNCGYGRGFSVLEVIDAVKKVAGHDFPVETTGRRAGDPPALVAGAEKVRKVLGWKPEHDDLEEIVASAYAWERHLMERNA